MKTKHRIIFWIIGVLIIIAHFSCASRKYAHPHIYEAKSS